MNSIAELTPPKTGGTATRIWVPPNLTQSNLVCAVEVPAHVQVTPLNHRLYLESRIQELIEREPPQRVDVLFREYLPELSLVGRPNSLAQALVESSRMALVLSQIAWDQDASRVLPESREIDQAFLREIYEEMTLQHLLEAL